MKYRWSLILFLFILTITTWLAVWWETPSKYLTVAFLDVGQGDAILITAPNKNQVLIDGGPNQSVVRALGQAMPFFDHSIDLVMATHPDSDHIGGLPEVFNRYQVSGFIEPYFPNSTAVYKNLEQKVADEKSAHLIAKTGTKIILAPDVTIEILSAKPWMLGPRGGKPDTNNSSIVARLAYASTTFLFTGDLPVKMANQLAYAEPDKIKVDVLKIAHHGGKSANSLAFLKVVKPEYAVISVGANNRYGHPSPETLGWLKTVGSQILQTKDLGTITLKSDGQSVGL
ncbi:MAG: MBL fold metallo-hydrolase [Candidatus Vogelbacteria bacterium]|nr:MBL fold metallo-hydrolase [Candidatus Vogelbacteria bacterium]